jgi:branched-chain amino acid transport system permease protein
MSDVLGAAIISGSIYALISLGFALGFRVSGVFNLAYGGLLVAAGYANYAFAVLLGLPTWLSIPISILLISGIGFAIEGYGVPFAKKVGLTSLDIMVLTWLLLVVMQDLVIIIFSSTSIYMGSQDVTTGLTFLGTHITSIQFAIMGLTFAGASVLFVISRFTASGREVTAVGDNVALATICGINVKRVIALNAVAASLLAAGAGVLLTYEDRLEPTLGMRFSIIAIVATLVGIRLGPGGAVLGAYAFGLLESVVLYLVDPGLRDSVVYFCLLAAVTVTYRRKLISDVG